MYKQNLEYNKLFIELERYFHQSDDGKIVLTTHCSNNNILVLTYGFDEKENNEIIKSRYLIKWEMFVELYKTHNKLVVRAKNERDIDENGPSVFIKTLVPL